MTYDVDGNREALIEGKTGFAVPAFDKQRLAAAIEKLLADPALRQRMGDAGREFALSRFDAQVMVQAAQERIYQQARSLSPSPSGLRL